MISDLAAFLCFPAETLDTNSSEDCRTATELFKGYCVNILISKVIEFATAQESLVPENNEHLISSISGALLFFDSRLKSMKLMQKNDSVICLINSKSVRARLKARMRLLSYARDTLICNNQNTVPVHIKGEIIESGSSIIAVMIIFSVSRFFR